MYRFMTSLLVCLFSITSYAASFSLKSSSINEGGLIPILYTCDGKNIPPELSWTNAPSKTQSFALVVSDPDAPNGTFYHWLVYNIPNNADELPQGAEILPVGVLFGKNSEGISAYKGPCPPKGSAHTYIFTLYALDTKLTLQTDATIQMLNDGMKNHILGTAKMSASYNH